MSKETVHLAVYDTLADWEYGHAAAHINDPRFQREPGRYKIVTVAPTLNPVTTAAGVRMVPDLAVTELRPRDSALFLLPGATAWDAGELGEFADKAGEFLDHGVPVAAICGATMGLARAGLLDDRAHTSSAAGYLAWSGYAGASRYLDEAVVDDGLLITAGPQSPVDFATAIFRRLDLYEQDFLDAWYGFHQHQDAGLFETMMTRATQEESSA
ncbi:glutamine amidotransferase [Allosaccharopolyspora coralli]|uniref:Glutamine amidotransferase n=1 Tax=Allosaccharopolyspora coralli TaxID=2665642 RepID=A0A5Q3QGC5_9PSEU|nr:DJ-1/PfpI family protein [Allosaccharopolyspora coralli]QGK69867.1 glutamine amidotransferase [Allosaccharopolyspora coralli]